MAGKALPSGTHLQVENCSFCHGNTVTVDGSGNVTHKDPKKHVNGVVDF
jgi:hypothetical protein